MATDSLIRTREAEIIRIFAPELARLTGRPEDDLVKNGLSLRDFQSNGEVELQFADQSHAKFNFAFFIASREKNAVAVFTEHCGYHVFPYVDTTVVSTYRETFSFGEDSEETPGRPQKWAVMRQDDNGFRDRVRIVGSEPEAKALRAELESHGHKQMYWIERLA